MSRLAVVRGDLQPICTRYGWRPLHAVGLLVDRENGRSTIVTPHGSVLRPLSRAVHEPTWLEVIAWCGLYVDALRRDLLPPFYLIAALGTDEDAQELRSWASTRGRF